MNLVGLITKIKISKRNILIVIILVSCVAGIFQEYNSINKLLKNEEINASLKMNQLYYFFMGDKEELQSLLVGNKRIGFYTDILVPQDREVVLYTFGYLLAPVAVDKNYLRNDTILMICFFKDLIGWLDKQKLYAVVFEKDYNFCKLAILKKRRLN